MSRWWGLLTLSVLLGWTMAPPGGVVVEGQLKTIPTPGSSTPFTITVSKGGLEYFGRILIALPDDCRLAARQLHGGALTFNEKRHVAVISWLKLPETDRFDLLLDLEVSPEAMPGPRSLEWDFSFIRNNDRVTVRPTPFHFEIVPQEAHDAPASRVVPATESADASVQSGPQAPDRGAGSPGRIITPLRDGFYEVRIDLSALPSGGFVKLEEQIPALCEVEIKSGGGSVSEIDLPQISFLWFDFQHTGSIVYQVKYCRLSQSEKISGVLSYVDGDQPISIPLLDAAGPELTDVERGGSTVATSGVHFEVQVAATNRQVVTDYFKHRLNFGPPVKEEFDAGRFKYLNGEFGFYEEARDHRESLKESYDFIGPFVVARQNGKRIPVQEALTRTGQRWMP